MLQASMQRCLLQQLGKASITLQGAVDVLNTCSPRPPQSHRHAVFSVQLKVAGVKEWLQAAWSDCANIVHALVCNPGKQPLQQDAS